MIVEEDNLPMDKFIKAANHISNNKKKKKKENPFKNHTIHLKTPETLSIFDPIPCPCFFNFDNNIPSERKQLL